MKKILAAIISICLLLSSLIYVNVSADTNTEGYYTYYILDNKAIISDCDTSISGDITIPATLGGFPVNTIGFDAFAYCSLITSVEVPDGVEVIGGFAFWWCTSLRTITIPNSVTTFGDGVFCQSGLVYISIPSSVSQMGRFVFSNCDTLTYIEVDPENQDFSSIDGVLFNKDKTQLLVCPAYNGYYNGSSYTVPDGVTSIQSGAFEKCESLTDITISNSVTSIGSEAFKKCNSLTKLNIGTGLTNIGESAFEDCFFIYNIYYSGSEEQWNNINIGEGNDELSNATIHYNSVFEEPTNPTIEETTSSTEVQTINPTTKPTTTNPNTTKPTATQPTTKSSTQTTVVKTTQTVCKHEFNMICVKSEKRSTYFMKGFSGDKYCSSCGVIIGRGVETDKLKLKTPSFKLTKGKKQFKVKYTSVKDATGFQVRYKIKGKWKIKNFNSIKTVTKTIKKLKKGTYKVQVRAFIKQGDNKAYSSWAKAKTVKVK